MTLRPYQVDGVNAVKRALGAQRVSGERTPLLFIAATGAGKTRIATELVAWAQEARPVRTVILVGRDKLVEQTERALLAGDLTPAVWAASRGRKELDTVTVVSIQSARTLTIPELELIVVDECHNVGPTSEYAAFLARHPGARIVGFTATPWRGAQRIYGEGQYFPRVTHEIGIRGLIDAGFLVRPVVRGMPEAFDLEGVRTVAGDYALVDLEKLATGPKIRAQVADALVRLRCRSKVVWTCVSIEHAEQVADVLAAAGETVVCVHSRSRDRRLAMDAFEKHGHRHAVSVMMLSEGVDIPAVDAIVLMRPTQSPTLAVQTIGRALRPHPDKTDALVLDYGRVLENCGPIDAPYVRDPGERKPRAERFTPTLRVCSECCAYVPFDEPRCPDCGHVESTVVDRLKALERRAAETPVLTPDENRLAVFAVTAHRHKAKSGNFCIRYDLALRQRRYPFSVWITERGLVHNRKFLGMLGIPADMGWGELWESYADMPLNAPKWIIVEKDEKGYERLKRAGD